MVNVNTPIDALPLATSLDGSELVPLDQGGTTKAATTAMIAGTSGNQYLAIVDGVTQPDTGGGYARIYIDEADGDLKIQFADGTIKTIVTDT